MPYYAKAVIIIAAVAVVSFFAAELLIPEKNAVTAKDDSAAEEQRPPQAQAADGSAHDEDIPVVVVDHPVPQAKEAPAPVIDAKAVKAVDSKTVKAEPVDTKTAKAVDTKTAKAEPIDTKTAKTLDAKTAKAEPIDTKTSKTLDAKTAKAEPVDTKTAKTTDAKALALAPPPQKTVTPPVQPANAVKPQPVAAEPPVQKKPASASAYRIEKAALCTAIKDREPQGVTDRFSKDAPYVYYFTSIVGARDTTAVIHRWYQNGKLIQTSILPVKSSYWRTHSRRNLLTHNGDVTGQWRVDVVETGTNKVMESASFSIE